MSGGKERTAHRAPEKLAQLAANARAPSAAVEERANEGFGQKLGGSRTPSEREPEE
jgi:hypothetical protein